MTTQWYMTLVTVASRREQRALVVMEEASERLPTNGWALALVKQKTRELFLGKRHG